MSPYYPTLLPLSPPQPQPPPPQPISPQQNPPISNPWPLPPKQGHHSPHTYLPSIPPPPPPHKQTTPKTTPDLDPRPIHQGGLSTYDQARLTNWVAATSNITTIPGPARGNAPTTASAHSNRCSVPVLSKATMQDRHPRIRQAPTATTGFQHSGTPTRKKELSEAIMQDRHLEIRHAPTATTGFQHSGTPTRKELSEATIQDRRRSEIRRAPTATTGFQHPEIRQVPTATTGFQHPEIRHVPTATTGFQHSGTPMRKELSEATMQDRHPGIRQAPTATTGFQHFGTPTRKELRSCLKKGVRFTASVEGRDDDRMREGGNRTVCNGMGIRSVGCGCCRATSVDWSVGDEGCCDGCYRDLSKRRCGR